jgi:hypothetical protein
MWQGITNGLLQGVASIGINYATQELGLNPLLANLGFSAISSTINAGIRAATGGSQDIFKTIYEAYEKNALTFLGYTEPGMPVSPWQQSAYLSQILDFSNVVQEKGLIDALNTYGAGFFNAVAINQIVQSGYTLGGYFADKLNLEQYTVKLINDKYLAAVNTPIQNDGGYTEVLFELVAGDDGMPYWNPVGQEEVFGNGQVALSIGEMGVDPYGKLGYTDADIATIFNSDIQYQKIRDGQQNYAEIQDLQGNTLIVIEPTRTGSYNVYNSYGDYVDAKINNVMKGYNYTLSINNPVSYNYNVNFASDTDFSWLNLNGLSVDDLANFRVTETSDETGAGQYTLEWKCGSSETIPSNWTDILKSPDAKERIINGFQGFGFITNDDISQDFERKVTLLNSSAYDTGTVISVIGRGASADTIKLFSNGPYNHTAILYIDDSGTKWVLEEEGPRPSQHLRKVALNDWLASYRAENDNISIGKLNDPNVVADLKNTMEQELFYWAQDANGNMKVTGNVIPIPYDSLNLIGIHWSGYICSSLIVQIYKDAGHPLFDLYDTDWQYRYSPTAVNERLKLLGHVD